MKPPPLPPPPPLLSLGEIPQQPPPTTPPQQESQPRVVNSAGARPAGGVREHRKGNGEGEIGGQGRAGSGSSRKDGGWQLPGGRVAAARRMVEEDGERGGWGGFRRPKHRRQSSQKDNSFCCKHGCGRLFSGTARLQAHERSCRGPAKTCSCCGLPWPTIQAYHGHLRHTKRGGAIKPRDRTPQKELRHRLPEYLPDGPKWNSGIVPQGAKRAREKVPDALMPSCVCSL